MVANFRSKVFFLSCFKRMYPYELYPALIGIKISAFVFSVTNWSRILYSCHVYDIKMEH